MMQHVKNEVILPAISDLLEAPYTTKLERVTNLSNECIIHSHRVLNMQAIDGSTEISGILQTVSSF